MIGPDHPLYQFTEEDAEKLKAMLEDYERSKWLGRLFWKLLLGLGAFVATLAAFKEHIVSIFKGH